MALNRSQTAGNLLGSLAPDLGSMEANVASKMTRTRRGGFPKSARGLLRARRPRAGQVTGNV